MGVARGIGLHRVESMLVAPPESCSGPEILRLRPARRHSAPTAVPRPEPHARTPAPCAPAAQRRALLAELQSRMEQVQRVWRRADQDHPPRCATALPPLDEALGGGFATAAVHEFLLERDAAGLTLAWHVAARAAAAAGWILYLDSAADFYPPAAALLGVPLERLLVVRPRNSRDALWVCEQALRCRAVATVLAPLADLPAQASRRLQLAAELGGGLGLLLRSAARASPTFVTTRLRLAPAAPQSFSRAAARYGPCTPARLRRLEVTILKIREGAPPPPFVLELTDAPHLVPAPALAADRSRPPRGPRHRSAAG